ncbi:MAG: hypothetical protein C4293_11350 [Nitrospiraceae bacterium]
MTAIPLPKTSLRTKTILALAVGLLVFWAILTAIQYQISSRMLAAEWESKAVEFARLLELSIHPLLQTGNRQALSRAVTQSLLIPVIKSVTVADAHGMIVADSTGRSIGKRLALHLDALREALEQRKSDISWVEPTEAGRLRYIMSPVRDASDPQSPLRGAILLGIDLSLMDHLIWTHVRSLLLINGIIFTALLVMFWIAVRIGLTQPLAILAQAVRLTPGSLPTASSSSDEIEVLTESFAHITEALQESERLVHAVLNSMAAHAAVLDKDGYLLAVNSAWKRFAKEHGDLFPPTEGGIVNYLDVCRKTSGVYGDQTAAAVAGIQAVSSGRRSQFTLEYSCALPNEHRAFLLSAVPLQREAGGAIIAHYDIAERKRAEEDLRNALVETERARMRLDTLYASIPIGLMYVTTDLIVERASRSIAELHGRSGEDHLEQWLPNLVPSDGWAKLKPIFEQVIKTGKPYFGYEGAIPDPRVPGGTRYFLSDYYPDLNDDGTVRGVHITTQDVTAQKQAQKEHDRHLKELKDKNRELDQMAIRDPLTGLYNRRFFDEALMREWQQFQRSGEAFTVIIMDVDAFKTINDEYGHEAGDRALQQVGAALCANLRESDLIARVGGDEFAALLPRTDSEHGGQVSEKLREVLRKLHLSTAAGDIPMTLSIGAATVPGFPPVSSAAELLRVADKRMYEAKRLASSGRSDAG